MKFKKPPIIIIILIGRLGTKGGTPGIQKMLQKIR
jgi:hypothetical protein